MRFVDADSVVSTGLAIFLRCNGIARPQVAVAYTNYFRYQLLAFCGAVLVCEPVFS